mgnify:CR=1 FL=1
MPNFMRVSGRGHEKCAAKAKRLLLNHAKIVLELFFWDRLMQNRMVRISATGNFSLTWPVDGVLRGLIGFEGNLAGQSSYTATLISPLLWSPSRTETPTMAPRP